MNIAIITGTRTGLGKSLERIFEQSRWNVASMSRPKFDLAQLDLAACEEFFDSIFAAQFERAVLIHNAAELDISPASATTANANRLVTVNLTSAIQLTSMFLKRIPLGEVALISSAAARVGITHWSLYCAAKAGMEGYLRALKAEGVTTHLVVPDVIDTEMQRKIRQTDWPEARRFSDYHSAGRLRSPSEVAATVLKKLDPSAPVNAPIS